MERRTIADQNLWEFHPRLDCLSPRESHGLTEVLGPSYHGKALRIRMVRNVLSVESLESGLFDSTRHSETLALLASAALSAQQPGLAFMFADRRCRNPTPTARDYLLRAEASRRAGYREYAANDLRRALEIDPVDDLVNSSALTWGTGDLRSLAAANFLAGEFGRSPNSRSGAASAEDRPAPASLRGFESVKPRSPVGPSGKTTPSLNCIFVGRTKRRLFDWSLIATIHWQGKVGQPRQSRLRMEAQSWNRSVSASTVEFETHISPPTRLKQSRQRSISSLVQVASRRVGSTGVDVIVPVYDDYEATKFCLDCLEREDSTIRKRILVVDDCSPNDRLRALLVERASRGAFVLIRNEGNLGFARSVNRALERCRDNDVLLVNADAFLPRGVIDKLSIAAYSANDIGTVTPLSNNGEFTSFPQPNVANPLGSIEDVRSIDKIAWTMNGADVVDLPNGVGFCLYIRRDCLDAVGGLPELYSRGYYEDVEFCLTTSERGLRNVCATGVFVGHAGAKSFRGEKRGLVLRNLGILEARFPRYRLECAAFLKADPLAPARMRIEECLTPKSPAVLLVSAGASARLAAVERARQIAVADSRLSCISCVYRDFDATAILRGAAGSAPQTLAFPVSDPVGVARLRYYLEALDLSAVELFDVRAIPTQVLSALLELPVTIRIVLADSQWLGESQTTIEGVAAILRLAGRARAAWRARKPACQAIPESLTVARIASRRPWPKRVRSFPWIEWRPPLPALISEASRSGRVGRRLPGAPTDGPYRAN